MQSTIMHTRKILLVFFVMIFFNSTFSQTISKQVIGSSGKTLTNSNLKINYSIGEPIVGLMTVGANQLGNGFHPSLNIQALSVEESSLDIQFKVYPHPTSQLLYVSHPELDSFLIKISNLNGELIYSSYINKEEPLDISNYSLGIYLITIENKETNKKNTYKIIKN